MIHGQTLGKCCYCGQKTVVTNKAVKCASCGAPITKFMSMDSVKTKPASAGTINPKFKKSAKISLKHSNKHKKKKSGFKRFFDIAEDIIDIFD